MTELYVLLNIEAVAEAIKSPIIQLGMLLCLAIGVSAIYLHTKDKND